MSRRANGGTCLIPICWRGCSWVRRTNSLFVTCLNCAICWSRRRRNWRRSDALRSNWVSCRRPSPICALMGWQQPKDRRPTNGFMQHFWRHRAIRPWPRLQVLLARRYNGPPILNSGQTEIPATLCPNILRYAMRSKRATQRRPLVRWKH